MYVYLNHFAVHLKRTQYCRSTTLQKKKKFLSLILANTWKIGGSLSTVDEAGHRLKVSPHSKLICCSLTPSVMVLGGRTLGRWDTRMELSEKRLVHLPESPHRAALSLMSCEDLVRRQPSMNKEAGPHQALNLLVPWPQPLELWEINFWLQATQSRVFCYSSPSELR